MVIKGGKRQAGDFESSGSQDMNQQKRQKTGFNTYANRSGKMELRILVQSKVCLNLFFFNYLLFCLFKINC